MNSGQKEVAARVNASIVCKEVRLIDADGNMVGIVSPEKANIMASEVGLDLVEISPNATPPVCKIMDFGKFKYDQQKREAEARKKQKTILCESRTKIYTSSRKNLEGNIIWMIWEIILKISTDVVNEMFQTIIDSILRLFSTRYTITTNKKRTLMIYHAIEILLFHKDIKTNTPIVNKTNCFERLEKNISVIFEQIKEKEGKSIPFKCWTEENKVYVKLNIEGGGTLSAAMNLDFASIFIQEAIPFILEKEANLIKDYLQQI